MFTFSQKKTNKKKKNNKNHFFIPGLFDFFEKKNMFFLNPGLDITHVWAHYPSPQPWLYYRDQDSLPGHLSLHLGGLPRASTYQSQSTQNIYNTEKLSQSVKEEILIEK